MTTPVQSQLTGDPGARGLDLAGHLVRVTDVADDRAIIAQGLRSLNEERAGPPDVVPLNVILASEAGETVGGLWGRTFWQWLYVELLFVPPALRGAGTGARLPENAESEARGRLCLGAYLDTFAFQAPGFYQRLGYTCFGTMDDFPPGSKRQIFLKRF